MTEIEIEIEIAIAIQRVIVIVFQIECHSQMGTVFATGFVSLLAEQVAEMVTRTAQLYDIPER